MTSILLDVMMPGPGARPKWDPDYRDAMDDLPDDVFGDEFERWVARIPWDCRACGDYPGCADWYVEHPWTMDHVNEIHHDEMQALVDLGDLSEELQRLTSSPELFVTEQKAEYFTDKTLRLLKNMKRLAQFLQRVHEDLGKAKDYNVTRTKRSWAKGNVTAAEDQPWQTWCCFLSVQKANSRVKARKTTFGDMELCTPQLRPPSGFPIAEHWRRKIEALVTNIGRDR